MKEVFTKYLSEVVGMKSDFCERVSFLHNECKSLSGEEFEDIFVSDNGSEGQHQYISLHFFTKNLVFKLDNFISQFVVNIGSLNLITRCSLTTLDFNLMDEKASPKSYIFVGPNWEPSPFALQLIARGDNCIQLAKLLKSRIFPNLRIR
jgi:hypothetical protein